MKRWRDPATGHHKLLRVGAIRSPVACRGMHSAAGNSSPNDHTIYDGPITRVGKGAERRAHALEIRLFVRWWARFALPTLRLQPSPLQFRRHRARRLGRAGEKFQHRLAVRIVARAELSGMDAGGDEQARQSHAV